MTNTEKLYTATVNVPGYLPMDDEPPTFDTAQEAWSYLCDERERGTWNSDEYDGAWQTLQFLGRGETGHAYAEIRHAGLTSMIDVDTLTGTLYADTPGYDGDHDLGLAYSVDVIEHVSYPHTAGYLYDCPACENGPCVCSADPERLAPCVSSNCERSE